MKNLTLTVALLLASVSTAHAQQQEGRNDSGLNKEAVHPDWDPQSSNLARPKMPPMPPATGLSRVYGVTSIGVTSGGDELVTAVYESGRADTLRAGGKLSYAGGFEYRFVAPFTLQFTVGYHVDRADASDGNIRFSRYPAELVGFYDMGKKWRVGAGVRHVTSVGVKSKGAPDDSFNAKFDDATGALVEIEYMFNARVGVKLRAVKESYKLSNTSFKANGDHVGLFLNTYFH